MLFARGAGILFPMIVLALAGAAAAGECKFARHHRFTDDFYFTASSDQGAVGDVVAVEINLTIEDLREDLIAFHLVGCYDPQKAELLEELSYSEFFDTLSYDSNFFRLGEPPRPQSLDGASRGFNLGANLRREAVDTLLEENTPIPILTLYFRLQEEAGDAFEVRFCDEEFYYFGDPEKACLRNYVYYVPSSENQLVALSSRHVSGEVRILPGEPTRTEPPDLPPLVKVYEEGPAPGDEVLFELGGAVAAPGDSEIPIDLYITSDFEFSGFSAAITFPSRYLRLARAEEHTRPGAVHIDNAAGEFGLLMQNSRRRVGAEGERARIATLYFDVLESAGEVEEVPIAFGEVGPFPNWIQVHTRRRGTVGLLANTVRVEPFVVGEGLVKIRWPPELPFVRGDANGDGAVNIADPVALLGYIFLGSDPPRCLDGADTTDDGRTNLSDAIATLRYLFLGEGSIPPPWPGPGLDPTPDTLDCAGV